MTTAPEATEKRKRPPARRGYGEGAVYEREEIDSETGRARKRWCAALAAPSV